MPWSSLWSSPEKVKNENDQPPVQRTEDAAHETAQIAFPTLHQVKTDHVPTTSSIWQSFGEPQTIIATVILTAACLGCFKLYRTFLRRIPEATDIHQSYFRKRSILGKVTSVGDGDNFRIYHTPGGWLAGWGWLPWRRVPKDKKLLKGQTIHVRIAGIDAPELAHFGRPSQPFSQEALDWLTSFVKGRRVRAYLHKPDQYSRVVATTYIWKGLFKRDVGLQMLKAGLACVYEAKTGAEFGKGLEQKYRDAERKAKLKRRGMWAQGMNNYESPREYKSKYSNQDQTSKK